MAVTLINLCLTNHDELRKRRLDRPRLRRTTGDQPPSFPQLAAPPTTVIFLLSNAQRRVDSGIISC